MQQPNNAYLLIPLMFRDEKRQFSSRFGLPGVTSVGKQRKWLISNAVLSVKRRKRAFLDAFGSLRAPNAAAKQRESLISNVQSRE